MVIIEKSAETAAPFTKLSGSTRPGPNRVAGLRQTWGNEGIDFLEILIYQDFWRIFEGFLGLPWAFLGANMA